LEGLTREADLDRPALDDAWGASEADRRRLLEQLYGRKEDVPKPQPVGSGDDTDDDYDPDEWD
jgi:hypothetical protein